MPTNEQSIVLTFIQQSDGGALWIVDGRVEISNSQFIDNFAEDVSVE